MNELTAPLSFAAYDGAGAKILLSAPIEWELVRTLDSPAHSFAGIFPWERACPNLFSVEVFCGTQRLFFGNLDEATVEIGEQGSRLKLLARSKGAVLLDNEALPQLYTNIRLSQLWEKHIQPYGFSLVTNNDCFFNKYQVPKGMSEWETVSNFFQNATQGVAMIDDDNQLICNNPRVEGGTILLSNQAPNALRFRSLKLTDNRYSPVSRFYIRDANGSYNTVFDNTNVTNLEISRKRYLIPPVEYTLTPTSIRLAAIIRIRRSMLGKRLVTAVCPGLYHIPLFERAEVDDGFTRQKTLAVHQVRLRASEAGLTTTLTLVEHDFI